MTGAQERHYKERHPKETAAYLKGRLEELGISVEETRIPKSSIGTYSMRVAFAGTDVGSNGKGVTEEYMEASAYAEFFERIQNFHMNPWGYYKTRPEGFTHCPDERVMTSLEIAQEAGENSFLHYYFGCQGQLEMEAQERAEAFRKLHQVEFHFGKGIDAYEARPFYSVRHDRVEYVPYYLCLTHYVSNGMCAGNTIYEALVQGFSEIMERHVQKKIFTEKPCLPDVPREYIQKFPHVWEMVEKLDKLPGIRWYLKDASFGGKYPVALLAVVSENTASYGVKLGCHPDFGIAMERCLTEASQGGDLQDYCTRSWIDFYNQGVDSSSNIYNSYKYGEAQYPYELFGSEASWPFTPVPEVSHLDNRQLFSLLARKFLDAGYDILLRDVSYLGFPSYQMLIPGFSEIQEESALLAKVYNTRAYLAPYLAYPERMGERQAKLLQGVLSFWEDSPMENQMKMIYSIYPPESFPGEDMRKGWLYLSAMCSVFLEDWKEAAGKILALLQRARVLANENENFYRALYEYLTLRDVGKSHEETMGFLHKFFEKRLCIQVEEKMENTREVFLRQYARYDYQGVYGEPLEGECARWEEIRSILFEEYKKRLPSQERLREVFQELEWEKKEQMEENI